MPASSTQPRVPSSCRYSLMGEARIHQPSHYPRPKCLQGCKDMGCHVIALALMDIIYPFRAICEGRQVSCFAPQSSHSSRGQSIEVSEKPTDRILVVPWGLTVRGLWSMAFFQHFYRCPVKVSASLIQGPGSRGAYRNVKVHRRESLVAILYGCIVLLSSYF